MFMWSIHRDSQKPLFLLVSLAALLTFTWHDAN
jgi:hypothetical protein